MNTGMPSAYDLHWKSIPMGAIEHYKGWYDPYLGKGVYLLVLATTGGEYKGYYVGKADDIGARWRQHVHEWLGNPHRGYSIPTDIDAFLKDPITEFNRKALERDLPERQKTAGAMLASTWFCSAEVTCLPGHRIEDVEYVLQEALKKHACITEAGWIGDAFNRTRPTKALTIRNHFGREFLFPVLPATIIFTVGDSSNWDIQCVTT